MKKISTKLSLSIILNSLVLALILIGTSLFLSSKEIVKEARKNLLHSVHGQGVEIEKMFASVETIAPILALKVEQNIDLYEVSNNESAMDEFEEEVVRKDIETMLSAYDDITSAWVVFNSNVIPGGNVVSISQNGNNFVRNEEYDANTFDKDGNEWWYETLDRGKYLTAPYVWERENGEKADYISFATRIDVNGRKVGIAGADINFSTVKEAMSKIQIYETGYVYMMDANYDMIAHPNPDLLGQNIRKIANGGVAVIGDEIDKSTKNYGLIDYTYNGDRKITGYYKLKNGLIMGLTAKRSEMVASLRKLLSILIVVTIIGMLVSSGIAYYNGKLISKPIIELSDKFQRASKGDLNVQTNITTNDEIGEMSKSFNEFIEKLKDVVSSIKEVSTAVQSENSTISKLIDNVLFGNDSEYYDKSSFNLDQGIEQLKHKTQTTLDDVRNQTASTQESLAALEEVSSAANEIKDNINYAKGISSEALEKAEEGVNNVQELNNNIENVNKSVTTANEKVENLIKLSNNIGEILTSIIGIAEQTNLLALNAAIEAARAGEAGKGFSVVAEEIRKLAEKTNSETDKIGEIIENIQKEVSMVKNSNERVTSDVLEGIDLNKKVKALISEIITKTQSSDKEIEKIRNALEEQVTATNEVTTSVSHVADISTGIEDKSTQNNNIAEDVAQVLERNVEMVKKLAEMASDLKDETDFFVVDNTGGKSIKERN